jgi:hypothetical protein
MIVGCAGAAPEDGITTNPDARHDTRSDGASPEDDTRPSGEDTKVPRDDTAVADTATSDDTAAGTDTADASPLTCALDEYDVDGDPSNGCEFKDTLGNHSKDTAKNLGSVDECDGSAVTHTNTYASDERLHGPTGESGLLGRADYIAIKHVAKTFCVNDPTYQVTTTGGVGDYRISVYRHGDVVELDPKCSPTIVGGAEPTKEYACTGQDDGEIIIFKIEKISGPREKVTYTLKYHN